MRLGSWMPSVAVLVIVLAVGSSGFTEPTLAGVGNNDAAFEPCAALFHDKPALAAMRRNNGDDDGLPGDSLKWIVGSWFGRAVPIDPFCEPGTAGCIVPPEVIMTPTFFADGVFMGSDNLTFGTPRTPGHGSWMRTGPGQAESTMVILQGDSDNHFIGAFRVRFLVNVKERDRLTGYVTVHFFPFVDGQGLAVLDPETGNPIPDPLTGLGPFITDPALCSPVEGCLALLEFDLRRITPALDR